MPPPIGSIIAWPGNASAVPTTNWAVCDGRPFQPGWDVPGLRRALGKDTDRLPDLRALFLRGANDVDSDDEPEDVRTDDWADPDGGRLPGTLQADAVGPHTHTLSAGRAGTGGDNDPDPNGCQDHALRTDVNDGPGETRVKNYGVLWLMKVRNN